MPTSPHSLVSACNDYPAPRKYVLVVSCVDARLLDDLVRFLDHDNLTNRYYHITLAGASLPLTNLWQKEPVKNIPDKFFEPWQTCFKDQFQAAVALTEGKITDVYIIQHADCGAFRVYIDKDAAKMHADDEVRMHRKYADALATKIRGEFCKLYNPPHLDENGNPTKYLVQKKVPAVHTFFMDLRGAVTRLGSWDASPDSTDDLCKDYGCYYPPDDEDEKKDATTGRANKPKS